jgi:tripeptidyl-peptidase-1
VAGPQLPRRYVHKSRCSWNDARSSHSPSKQITAAIIALLNDARLRAGKPVLGFLNPWIYSSGYKGFTDITAGQSDGCNGNNTQTGAAVNGVSHTTLHHSDT